MLTHEQYNTAVFNAYQANSALTEMLRAKESLGCYPDWSLANVQNLKIQSGLWSMSVSDFSSDASVDIYNQLLDIGSTWFGGIHFDPNVQPPEQIIIINTLSTPEPIDFGWDAFSVADSPDGGETRVIYSNTDWKGFDPVLSLISPQETAMELGVDYTLLVDGGIQILPTSPVLPGIGNGAGIVEGQILRSSNYRQA